MSFQFSYPGKEEPEESLGTGWRCPQERETDILPLVSLWLNHQRDPTTGKRKQHKGEIAQRGSHLGELTVYSSSPFP